jgi:hypothetical protein
MTMTNLLLVLLLLVLLVGALGILVTKVFLVGLAVVLLIGLVGGRRLHKAQVATLAKNRKRDGDMTRDSVTKLVSSFRSKLGRIRSPGDSREVFSNAAWLDESVDASAIEARQAVVVNEHGFRPLGGSSRSTV